jgi:hypothetical protein
MQIHLVSRSSWKYQQMDRVACQFRTEKKGALAIQVTSPAQASLAAQGSQRPASQEMPSQA